MRVPTLQNARTLVDTLVRREAEQARLQAQVASGQRVRSPGDDPLAAAQAEQARSRLAQLAQDQRAAQLAQGALAAADAALGQGVDLLQGAGQALVAAGNGAYGPDDRRTLALQLRATRAQLVDLANGSDGAGGYVFGGQGSAGAPLAAEPASYAPAAGTQRIGAGGRFATTVDGRAALMALPQGNGVFVTASAPTNTGSGWIGAGSVGDPAQLTGHDYAITIEGAPGALRYTVQDVTAGTTLASGEPFTAGATIEVAGQRVQISGTPAVGDSFRLAPAGQQSVFGTLDEAIALLEDGAVPPGAYAERLERVQAGLARALDALSLERSRTGEEARRVDGAAAANAQQELDAAARRSDLRDLDLAKGISELQNGQVALEAALKAYATIGRASLFDLLR